MADGVGREGRHDRHQGPAIPPARRRRQVGALHRRCRRQRQHRRDVGSVGQAAASSALGLHQPVRSREARVGRRRQHAGDLPVHARRQAARADDWHAGAGGRGRDALQPADVHRLAARRNVLRLRRLHRHARREVRQEREVRHAVGHQGQPAEREAAQLHEQRARGRRRSGEPARVRQRLQQPPRTGVRREREVPVRLAHRRRSPACICSTSGRTGTSGRSIAARTSC